MPLYDYRCPKHGLFEELVPGAAGSERHPCPGCGAPAARVIATPHALLDMDPGRRDALARNERSRHEPRVHAQHGSHRPGCGCGSGAPARSRAQQLADGSRTFPARRPWMIGH
ncbi:MAG: formamidase [Porticoccaceae bacterium]|nr:formamidase [Porticoccaceae bacterium]